MTYDVSIIIPGIRTHNWHMVYDSIKESCKRHTFEAIFAGPFDPPPNLPVKYIKTYTRPSCACQIAAEQGDGFLYCGTADDALFIPDALDLAIEQYHKECTHKDVINIRFTEGNNWEGHSYPEEWWLAHTHPCLRQQSVKPEYRICMIPLVKYDYYREMGGLDCAWEYPNFNIHDLMFRIQHEGGKIINSADNVANCNYYQDSSGDHAPIDFAWRSDMNLFIDKYSQSSALETTKIPFDNWKRYPEPWTRRFSKKLYTSYAEMMTDN